MRPARAILRPAAVAAALALAPAAWATDLLDTWRAAAAHDPEFAAARAASGVAPALARQATSLWRPSIGLEAGIAQAGDETAIRGAQFAAPGFGRSTGVAFDTSVTNGWSTRYGVVLRQPLWNAERDAQASQLRIAADGAGIAWQAAQQDLILRSVERYLALGVATRQVRLLADQEAAALQARTEAQDRFRLGDKPVTDVHEATARAESLTAERLGAQAALDLQRARFTDLTGMPAPPAPAVPGTAAPQPGDLARWLDRAAASSPDVLQAQARLRSAEEEVRKTAGSLAPTLDVLAQAGRERLTGHGDFGGASQLATRHAIGVQLSIPLSTGGWRGARQDESVALAAKARADLDRTRQQVAQQVRQAWLGLATGAGRVRALEAGWQAGLARLDATRTGLQAGDRTTMDLLNAQNDATSAELALLQARVQLFTDRLRLAALAGDLGEQQLAEANRDLVPAAAPPRDP